MEPRPIKILASVSKAFDSEHYRRTVDALCDALAASQTRAAVELSAAVAGNGTDDTAGCGACRVGRGRAQFARSGTTVLYIGSAFSS